MRRKPQWDVALDRPNYSGENSKAGKSGKRLRIRHESDRLSMRTENRYNYVSLEAGRTFSTSKVVTILSKINKFEPGRVILVRNRDSQNRQRVGGPRGSTHIMANRAGVFSTVKGGF